MSTAKARYIFIGNIPYGLTEEQIQTIFSSAGQVLSFRLVYDKDTGRPKGFGFLEFADSDAAASAVRNLDQYEVMGRKLRVDYTNESGASEGTTATGMPPTGALPVGADMAATGQPSAFPPLPPGQELPQGVTCIDAISRTLAAVSGPQLLDILSTMKGVVSSEPKKATELLSQAPQLSYAIFQSLLLLGLIDTTVLQTVLGQAQAAPSMPLQQAQLPPGSALPPPPMGQPQYPPPSYAPQHMQPPVNPMTPPSQNPYQQPPAPMAPPAQQLPQEQEALIQRLMTMSQQELDGLDPAVRSQIQMLRQQFMSSQA